MSPGRGQAPMPSPEESAVIDRFGIFDEEKRAAAKGDRSKRVVVRVTAGLALLLMLALPLSLVPTIWTGDFRWLLSGVVLGVVGFGIGVLIRDAGRKLPS